jgi:hypothetical protein
MYTYRAKIANRFERPNVSSLNFANGRCYDASARMRGYLAIVD